MEQTKWYQGKIIKGKKIGKTLGFPTLNLDNSKLLQGKKTGVYAVRVKIDEREYKGVLYYGPRKILGEENIILEIHVFDFHQQIYGRSISFQILDYIRRVIDFPDFVTFKKQLKKDCQKVKEILK